MVILQKSRRIQCKVHASWNEEKRVVELGKFLQQIVNSKVILLPTDR